MTKPDLKPFDGPAGLLDQVLDLDYFHKGDDGSPAAIPALRVEGDSRLVVIVGDNAGGKSFCRRLVQVICHEVKVECMAISAEGRRKISGAPWLVMVYGDEEYEATGVNSSLTVLTAISSSKTRDKGHVIFWDEPDIGLSDSWAAGAGVKIREYLEEPVKTLLASFVVSHNKALVRELLPLNPTYLHVGTDPDEAPASLQEWLDRPVQPLDLDLLKDRSRERFHAIQKHLNRKRP